MPGEQHGGPAVEQQVRDALNRYLAARTAARPAGRPGAEAELLAARLALAALLRDAGWRPAPSVQAALDADAVRLHDAGRRSA